MNLTYLLKLVISILLFAYLFLSVDFKEFIALYTKIDFTYLVVYFVMGLVTTLFSSIKWLILCRALDVKVSLRLLYSYYFLGYFYNNFLPTSVGGDVVRGLELSKWSNSKADSFATVFAERYSGFITLVLLISLVIFLDERIYSNLIVVSVYVLLIVAFVFGSLLIFNQRIGQFFERRFPFLLVKKICGKVSSFQESLFLYRRSGKTLVWAMVWSFLYYFAAIMTAFVGFKTLNVDLSLANVFIAVPIMMMLFLLPISLGGLGLQEWAHAFVFSLLGVSTVIGVGLGILFRFRQFLFSGVGALVSMYIVKKNRAD